MNADSKIKDVLVLFKKLRHFPYIPATFATSFGIEDMVLMDLIVKHAPWVEIFTLDTGRLPEETYDLMQLAINHYCISIKTYFPQHQTVQDYIQNHGPNAFYEDLQLRKACCHMRKVEPLQRALYKKTAWLTGMRRSQALSRQSLNVYEWDEIQKLHKFNPLADWSEEEVWNYIHNFKVPYNSLHDKGYPSIGCSPCTRAVFEGQDIRAGRWWWENPEFKECGLHFTGDKLIRTKSATPLKTSGEI